MSTKASVFVLLMWAISASLHAQDETALRAEIAQADAEFFTAFNTCDVEKMGEMFSRDLEFYHDISGLSDYAGTMQVTKDNCDRKLDLKRELVEDSLEVYPVKDHGAMQIGSHTFCHVENGKNDCGTFEFVHIWRRTPEGWKISRVISYGH